MDFDKDLPTESKSEKLFEHPTMISGSETSNDGKPYELDSNFSIYNVNDKEEPTTATVPVKNSLFDDLKETDDQSDLIDLNESLDPNDFIIPKDETVAATFDSKFDGDSILGETVQKQKEDAPSTTESSAINDGVVVADVSNEKSTLKNDESPKNSDFSFYVPDNVTNIYDMNVSNISLVSGLDESDNSDPSLEANNSSKEIESELEKTPVLDKIDETEISKADDTVNPVTAELSSQEFESFKSGFNATILGSNESSGFESAADNTRNDQSLDQDISNVDERIADKLFAMAQEQQLPSGQQPFLEEQSTSFAQMEPEMIPQKESNEPVKLDLTKDLMDLVDHQQQPPSPPSQQPFDDAQFNMEIGQKNVAEPDEYQVEKMNPIFPEEISEQNTVNNDKQFENMVSSMQNEALHMEESAPQFSKSDFVMEEPPVISAASEQYQHQAVVDNAGSSPSADDALLGQDAPVVKDGDSAIASTTTTSLDALGDRLEPLQTEKSHDLGDQVVATADATVADTAASLSQFLPTSPPSQDFPSATEKEAEHNASGESGHKEIVDESLNQTTEFGDKFEEDDEEFVSTKTPEPTVFQPPPPPPLVEEPKFSVPPEEEEEVKKEEMGRKNYNRENSSDKYAGFAAEPDCIQRNVQALLGQNAADILYWRDPKNTGAIFGAGLVILFSLTIFSVISVVAYTLLFTLLGTLSFRVYKNVMQAINKTEEGHPFKEYLDIEIAPSQERAHEIADQLLSHFNCFITRMRSVLLVEDYVESFKYLFLFWAMTFIGSWFNGMTLVILAYIACFSLPKVYEMNQAQVDHYLNLVTSKINEITEKIPFLKKASEKKEN